MNTVPMVQDVVLVGGGHSHVILIRMWAMNPFPGVRLTLVSEKVDTPYSGMLPGLIAGHYTEEDVHVDLARVCSWANVRFIERRVESIDLDAKQLRVNDDRPPIGFDVLSLDTGSTPELNVKGSELFSVPVKPVYNFYGRWLSLLERVRDANKALSIGVVGSGAGGFELITAMRHALQVDAAECHWIVRGETPLKGRPEQVAEFAIQAAESAGVIVHKEFDVVDVKPNALLASDGREVVLDEIIWCAAAKAPHWPKESGLTVDPRGFVFTNAHLQSVSHEFVFATGDIGTQQETPSAKAGVFAVRQAPVLFQNIRRYLLRTSLKVYKPQTDFLSLMATGSKHAIGNRGFVTVQGGWVWRLKDHIDQKFMNQFRNLAPMQNKLRAFKVPHALLKESSVSIEDASNSAMRCRGCGAKVGGTILDSVLEELSVVAVPGVLQGLDIAGDAAVINTALTDTPTVSTNTVFDTTAVTTELVQSVDQISAICDDPYVFGRIAAVHALSDVVAAGAIPHSAQAIVSLPFADKRIVKRDLQHLMAGVVDALNENGCSLVGGHTAEGAELTLGFVVNGFMRKSAQSTLASVPVGSRLILTKPIGSGVLLAGMMQQKAAGSDVQAVLKTMQQSNFTAANVFYEHSVSALTDITGFGLLGHLQRLLHRHNVGAQLQANAIKTYDGAIDLVQQGVSSTLLEQNQQVLEHIRGCDDTWKNLLCDPQTSGGLLGVVPENEVESVLRSLQSQGCVSASVIGSITSSLSISIIG